MANPGEARNSQMAQGGGSFDLTLGLGLPRE